MSKKSLKTKNLKYIGAVLVLDATLLWMALSGQDMTSIVNGASLHSRIMENSIIASAVPVIALLLSYLVPANLKANLVFWKIKNALPGCRAFSEIAHKDTRIDIPALHRKLGDLPSEPHEQNSLWYQLYKKHELQPSVQETHRRFLFFRDISSISFLLIAVLLLGIALGESNIRNYSYAFIIVFTQYLLFTIAARNAGIRLVQNVLALESAEAKAT